MSIPLPDQPSAEQFRKRAKDLCRAVRAHEPAAVALVERHGKAVEAFSLSSAQFVVAREHGFASWPRLREHLARAVAPAWEPVPAMLTPADRHRLRPHWASPRDLDRCAVVAGRSEAARWIPLFTAHHNGVTVIAFTAPGGVVFAELTAERVIVSGPHARGSEPAVVFRTDLGTIAGVVDPAAAAVSVQRVGDRRAWEAAVVAEGVFAAPNAFRLGRAGVVVRVDGADSVVSGVDLPATGRATVDRAGPPVPRESAADRAFLDHLVAADTPPVVDPHRWRRGVSAALTDTEDVQLGRHGRLLCWYRGQEAAFVFDFGPRQGPVQDFAVVGDTLAATRMYHGFVDGRSDRIAVVGLVRDERVASIRLRRDGYAELAARIGGGTFLVADPGLTSLRERGTPPADLVAFDDAGAVLEVVPWRRGRSAVR